MKHIVILQTIGNNEGMTISHDALQNLYNDADFKVICTNVIDEEDIFHIILPLRISKK